MKLSKIRESRNRRIRCDNKKFKRSSLSTGNDRLRYSYRNIEKKMRNPDYETPASEEFESCFVDGGTSIMECDCGRVNFATESEYWKEDEETTASLKYYFDKHFESPDEYIMHGGYSYVSIARINGEEIVIGCPCNRLGRYEEFINAHADVILAFLHKKYTRELERKLKSAELAWKANAAKERLERTEKL